MITLALSSRRASPRVRVSLDNNHCHRFALCQQEAPELFELTEDGRVVHERSVDPALLAQLRQAARVCPMQAITIIEPT